MSCHVLPWRGTDTHSSFAVQTDLSWWGAHDDRHPLPRAAREEGVSESEKEEVVLKKTAAGWLHVTNSKIRNERRVEEHVTLLLTSTNLTGDDPFWDLSSKYIRRKCLKVWAWSWSLHSKVAHMTTIAVYLVNSRTWRSSYFSSALGWTNKYKLEKSTSSKILRSSKKSCNHIHISLNCILNVFFFSLLHWAEGERTGKIQLFLNGRDSCVQARVIKEMLKASEGQTKVIKVMKYLHKCLGDNMFTAVEEKSLL